MKNKIEAFISKDKIDNIDEICEKEHYTRAEFLRRAIDCYILTYITIKDN